MVSGELVTSNNFANGCEFSWTGSSGGQSGAVSYYNLVCDNGRGVVGKKVQYMPSGSCTVTASAKYSGGGSCINYSIYYR